MTRVPEAAAVRSPAVAPAVSPSADAETAPARIAELDGLRGLAIGAVLVMHLYIQAWVPANSIIHAVLHQLFDLSYTGVDLFFVLSGYLIGGILLRSRSSPRYYRDFYWRRFFRIVPLYALLLLSWHVFQSDELNRINKDTLFTLGAVPMWAYALFVQNIVMAVAYTFGCLWLSATWSLGVEEQFYLAMPWLIRRLKPERLFAVAVFLILLAPALRLCLIQFSPATSMAAVLLPVCRMDALLFGVVAALVVRDPASREWLHARHSLLVSAAMGLAVLFVCLSLGRYGLISWVITPLGHSAIALFYFVLLLLAIHPRESAWRRTLRWSWLRGLGVISYFVYLFHQPVNFLLHGWIRGQAPHLGNLLDYAVTLLVLIVTFGLGALSWVFLERPLLAATRRTGSRG